jgi:hypothetical protein
MPHFDAIPAIWKPMIFALQKQLKDQQRMIGVDEDTALIGSLNGSWKAMGKSSVQVFMRDAKNKYQSGEVVPLS